MTLWQFMLAALSNASRNMDIRPRHFDMALRAWVNWRDRK